jgi:peptide/nickel transport system permease protein
MSAAPTSLSAGPITQSLARPSAVRRVLANSAVRLGGGLLAMMLLLAIAAPLLYTIHPNLMDPASANLPPGSRGEFVALTGETFERIFPMGTDGLGRDIWSRAAYGARVSLAIGAAVALCSILCGVLLGMMAGYFRGLDGVIMRIMDGMMAIPGIVLAMALIAVWQPGLLTVIFAITIGETPRVARLVRSVVLSLREEPYVEAAIALGTPAWGLMLRHILPNAAAPLVVQGTFICAAAMLIEAAMSFLGIGLPPTTPSWGGIMSGGRADFSVHPYSVLLPGVLLAATVLAVNMLGDGLRDTLDPKFLKRGG